MTRQIRIVEYAPEYAGSIAEMWNQSGGSWGGNSHVRTEENIRQEHENSTNMHVFLALNEHDGVVGYCSFSHYRNDEGALYIPLLNVRPDYHGKKVGKALVLHAVNRTVQLGWPRLDLFTWEGNTKAVPMYKKCGFFWEDKEDSTHLMNFIPTVLQTEALQPYFQTIDWYEDGKRNLEIKPDGRKENGFDFLEYRWEKGEARLRVEFEKTGRGLRLIESDDYLISVELDNHKCVFGQSYPVRYSIRNKTGAPLSCLIKGEDHKNIRFQLERSVQVHDVEIVEGQFTVDPVSEKQSSWKTHPCVTAELVINGKKARFRIGIEPEFPLNISWTSPQQESNLHMESESWLNVENRFQSETTFDIAISGPEWVRFAERTYRITLPAEGKRMIELPYVLQQFGIFAGEAEIRFVPSCGADEVSFTRPLQKIFKGQTGMFGGKLEKQWAIVNGPYTVYLNIENNESRIHHFQSEDSAGWIYPKLGRPFSAEFSKKQASEVSVSREDEAMVLRAVYISDEYTSLRLVSVTKLYARGLAERYYELENVSNTLQENMVIGEGFYQSFQKGIIPYQGDIISLRDEYTADDDYWDVEAISENWLFSNGRKMSSGFCWHPSQKLVKHDWHYGIEHTFEMLEPGAIVRTTSTFMSNGTFTDWFDFRSFAISRRDQHRPDVSDHLELAVNGNNPFVQQSYSIEVIDRKRTQLSTDVTVQSESERFALLKEHIPAETEDKSARFSVMAQEASDQSLRLADVIRLQYRTEQVHDIRERAVFPETADAYRQYVLGESGTEIYCFENGILSMKASPSFGNAVYSLMFDGQEWLDSSYPAPGPKSWWNPWIGGIAAGLSGISLTKLLVEQRSVGFTAISDNKGNEWKGIEIVTSIEQHEGMKGIQLHQYYVMLPGVSVLCCVNKVVNNTEHVRLGVRCNIDSFLRLDDDLMKCWFRGEGNTVYRCGKVTNGLESEGVLQFGSDPRKVSLLAVHHKPQAAGFAYANNELIKHGIVEERIRLLPGAEVFTRPLFFVFHDKWMPYEQLTDLSRLKFGSNRDRK